MRKKYFLNLLITVFFLTYVSSSAQSGCSSLEITATQDGAVCGAGSVKLEATPSGTGDEVLWYNAATGGDIIGLGNTIYIPEISATTSYWVAEANVGQSSGGGSLPTTYCAPAPMSSGCNLNDFIDDFILEDSSGAVVISHLGTGCAPSAYGDYTGDSSLAGDLFAGETYNFEVTHGTSSQSVRIWIDYDANGSFDDSGELVFESPTASGNSSTPTTGTFQVPQNVDSGTVVMRVRNTYSSGTADSCTQSGSYGEVHDYKINLISTVVLCESNRVEVIAEVSNVGDEEITTFPYSHSANTNSYGNNYSGIPGADCGSNDAYLDGYDVVYHYAADDDYLLDINLTGLSESHTGIFVYEDCSDIGTSCAAEGSVSDSSTGDHGFELAVENGKDYYIVVSSSLPTESFDYTLTIDAVLCSSMDAPIGDATQAFFDGQVLSDLTVDGVGLTWYSDAALTTVIADPDSELLVDNATYYVTQSVDTCEGQALAITVTETPCATLAVASTEDGAVCGGGSVTLSAQKTSSSSSVDIFWYDSATGGNKVGDGEIFETPALTQTTSFWAAEVALTGGELAGQGKPTYTTVSQTSGTGWGLVFDAYNAFTIIDVEVYSTGSGGDITIELQDDSGNMIESGVFAVPGGGTSTVPVPATLTLNFDVPAAGEYRLRKTSAGVNMVREFSANNNFPYPLGSNGEIIGGYLSSTNTSYYWFYNWTIGEVDALCESSREEVIAEVNNVADESIASFPYSHVANTSSYDNNYAGAPGSDCGSSDAYLDGYDVVYHYAADDDYLLEIELSGLNETHTAVFVFEDCADIGTSCTTEGSVGDSSTDDHGFELAVENGKDYYIVVSSSLPTESFDYTLTIDAVLCSNMDAPIGDATQAFFDGQSVGDLTVDGVGLTWYSDAALTTVITDPDSELLVDNATYYVTQSVDTCEGQALAITVTETPCSTLAVATTEGSEVCGNGSVTLSAQKTSSSSSVDIFWYDSATGGNKVGAGETFETPALTQTTSFWAAEVALTGGELAGQAKVSPTGTSSYGSTLNYGLQFDVDESFSLHSVDVYPDENGNLEISLFDSSGQLLDSKSETVSTSTDPVTIVLDFEIPEGQGYRLLQTSSPSIDLIRDSSGNNFPYELGDLGEYGAITNGTYGTSSTNSSSYYYFYNWTLGSMEVVCESNREEVIAEVNNVADEIVSGSIPYTHTASTSSYGNNYAGEAGGSCDSGNYLDGYDVVYQFTPTTGAVYSIELSGLTDDEMGVFVFESCSDIGSDCFAGAVSDGTTSDFGVEEVLLQGNTDYYIVISSKNLTNADYTITIDQAQIDCADYTSAPLGRENQLFQAGDTLGDLVVTGPDLKYYADASLTTELLATDLIVDGDTYYITQTINNTCESDALVVTVELADCTVLEVTSTDAGDTIFCSGETTISAVGSGTANTALYWFDAAVGGNILGIGEDLDTGVLTETTSFWVADVLEYEADTSPLPTYCTPSFSSGCGLSDYIDDFILEDSAGNVLISHLGTGCSTDAYGDYTSDANLTATLMAGETYDFEATHGTSNQYVRIWIDLDRNGSFEDAGEMLYEATSSASSSTPTVGEFTIPNVVGNFTTVMRVKTTWSTGASDSCTQSGSYGEVHDYLVTIKGASAFCESARTEVIVEVDTDGDHMVSNLPYTHSDTTGSYGNNYSGAPGSDCATTDDYLDGHEVIYTFEAAADDVLTVELTNLVGEYAGVFVYDSCLNIGTECMDGAVAGATEDDLLIENLQVVQGNTYYIVVSSWQTTSIDYTLKISSFACAALEAPTGDATQEFIAGDVVSDLDVQTTRPGATLNWYEDATLNIPITDPDTELLVDATTYYVTQLFAGCEGDALAITVEEFDCSTFEIVSFTDGEVLCSGSVVLEAQASGTGTDIYWYDAPTDGNMVGIGTSYTTPNLTQTTSYWAAEVFTDQGTGSGTGGPLPTYCTPSFNTGCTLNDTIDDFILEDNSGSVLISHLGTGCSANAYGDYTGDSSLTANLVAGSTYNFEATHGTSSQYLRIWIDLDGNGSFEDSGELVYESTSAGSTTVPTIGSFTIPQNVLTKATVMRVKTTWSTGVSDSCTQTGSYGEVHDYKVTLIGAEVVCESPRQEVVATVKTEGDYIVTDTDLTYIDQNDTAGFGNNYPTSVGSNCVTNDTLEGEGVVYSYMANQTDDDILMIELSNVTVNDALVLVYESCSDFGTQCFASAEVDNGIALIEDLYVDAGSELFILVTSKTGSFDYTLTIDGLDCNNVPAPTGDTAPFFIAGDFLSSLQVDGSVYNQGFTWYSDAALTNEIVDPSTELLVDNTIYYVTQTILGCESDALAITAMEFDCSYLSPDIITPLVELCLPGGEVTLQANVNAGDEVYWYDSVAAVDPIHRGSQLELGFVDETVSYWVSEVTLTGSTESFGATDPSIGTTSTSSLTNHGMNFTVINETVISSVDIYPTASVGSNGTIEIREGNSATTGAIVATIPFTTTVSGTLAAPEVETIILDVNLQPGNYTMTPGTGITMIRNTTGAQYPYTSDNVEITGNTFNTAYWYYFYNWTVGSSDVICESVREEVQVIVSDEFPDAPEIDSTVVLCGDEHFTLGDVEVDGDHIQWYDEFGNKLDLDTIVIDGETYYITQNLGGCISQIAEVTIIIRDVSDMPTADAEQTFVEGETLAHLEVDGRNIRWYDDADKNNELLPTTTLIDDTTYYVTQTQSGLCESEPMAIHVTETLGVTDVVFENVQIAPNPVVDYLHVINISKIDDVEVYDMTGRRLMKRSVENSANQMKIDFTQYSTGVYFLNLTKEGKAKRIRVIKK